MKKRVILKTIGALICALITVINFSNSARTLQDTEAAVYYASEAEKQVIINELNTTLLSTGSEVPASALGDESFSEEVTVSLFGVLPIKKISLVKKEGIVLVPAGLSVGISIDINGLLVVGMGEVVTDSNGSKVSSPAARAGVCVGDYIIAANNIQLTDSDSLAEICKTCQGKLIITVKRENSIKDIEVTPAFDTRSNTYKVGVWVREDTAGIGTLSYYDPHTNGFAALGHPVTDIDTGSVFTVRNGSICNCNVVGITKGKSGVPGELTGMFSSQSEQYGRIYKNTDFGVFGEITSVDKLSFKYANGLPLGYPDEIHTGDATILSSPRGDEAQEYSCRIVKLSKQTRPSVKGIIIEITDEKLITDTGGIVQGMSGSPIIQDGKLVGVVTHVMINNPERGYGIYAYWMYSEQNSNNG